jgi:hypothetical protein
MVKHLLKNFLSSEHEYERVVALWRSLLEEAAARVGQSGEWVPWRPATFADGTAVPRDLRPIIDARSARLAKAITISQHPPESDHAEIAAWLTTREWGEPDGRGSTDELEINLALSEETLQLARRLIEKWMDPGTSRERMEDVISETLGSRR